MLRSRSNQHRFLQRAQASDVQRVRATGNNNVNSWTVNSNLLGTCESKFDSINNVKAFGWELTSRQMQMIKTGAKSGPIKDIESGSEKLYTAQFEMMNQNHGAVFKIVIKCCADKTEFQIRYYFIVDGKKIIRGNFISYERISEILQHNGFVQCVAEFVHQNENVFDENEMQ